MHGEKIFQSFKLIAMTFGYESCIRLSTGRTLEKYTILIEQNWSWYSGKMADYPPNGLPASIKALPEWIQKGCGDKEYYCEEKNATFLAGNMPEKCPDLSNHNNFFAETMRKNPGLYEKLRVSDFLIISNQLELTLKWTHLNDLKKALIKEFIKELERINFIKRIFSSF